MERSSPLAAMQPPGHAFGHGHWGLGMAASAMHANSRLAMGAINFDFREMSMTRAPSDYFNYQPARAASPTANLAVDLSRNFHIDKSPQPPTPRRSLFSTNLLSILPAQAPLQTPIPTSSSPGPAPDSMDISPLPHKTPRVTTVQVQSPTPDPTPCESVSMPSSPPGVMTDSPVDISKPLLERKRPNLLRPCLSRTKGLTTTAVSTRSAGLDAPPRPFPFGNAAVPAANLTLDECFNDSPERPGSYVAPGFAAGPPRPRSAYQRSSAMAPPPPAGSPNPILGRRPPPVPLQRPRKQFRRTLSMFESPAEVLNQQPEEQKPVVSLHSVMDIDEPPALKLPHFLPEHESIPRITKDTMIDVLDGKFQASFDDCMIIDCRFEYEYKGGHIDGAINFNDKEELASQLFAQAQDKPRLLIFHCEYSAHRAPIAARYIRAEDRTVNAHRYPQLSYPEIYILDGGYSAFFHEHKHRCFPPYYVEMNDEKHASACERGLGRIRQPRAKLSRAQTFAFGQSMAIDDDSPTNTIRGRAASNNVMATLDVSLDAAVRAAFAAPMAQRMSSY